MLDLNDYSRREVLRLSATGAVGTAMLATAPGKNKGQNEESWPQYGYDSGNSGYAPDNSGPVSNVEEGWSFETGEEVSTPAVVNGIAYFGGDTGNLYAVDATNGNEEWVFEDSSEELGMPTVTNDTVYVNSDLGGDYTYAVDAGTGEQIWVFETYGPQGSPAVVDETVYIGGANAIYAVDAVSGEQIWDYRTGRGTNSSPAVVGDTVYIANSDDNLIALDTDTGETQWTFSAWISSGSPAVVDGTVYFKGSGTVHAVDAATGDEQWTVDTGDRLIGSPAVANGTVYMGGAASTMYALNSTSGDQQWTFEAGAQGYGSPTVVGNTVYVGSHFNSESHKLYAIDGDSGDKRWEFGTENWVTSPPTVADGTLYFEEESGLYALTGRTSLATPTVAGVDSSSAGETIDSEGATAFGLLLAALGLAGVSSWWVAHKWGESEKTPSDDSITTGDPSPTSKTSASTDATVDSSETQDATEVASSNQPESDIDTIRTGSSEETVFCVECGQELPATGEFCTACGSDLPNR